MKKNLLLIITFFIFISCSQDDTTSKPLVEEPIITDVCDCFKTEVHYYESEGEMVLGDTVTTDISETDCELDGSTTITETTFNGQLLRTVTTLTCLIVE